MSFQDFSIRTKVVIVIMVTSVAALLVTVAAFMLYDFITYRDTLVRNLSTSAAIIANNSTAALTFQDEETSQQILAALKEDPTVAVAALYDTTGSIFARYPAREPISSFPVVPGKPGHQTENGHLIIFQPVSEGGRSAGTLYLKSNLHALYQRPRLYGGIALIVLFGSALVALILSSTLQQRITTPILELASSASAVSERGDYSVRVKKRSTDELGALTDAFNLMLERIQRQTVELASSEERLRLALEGSRTGTWDWDLASGKVNWDTSNTILFGLQPGQFKGTYEHFSALIHPDERDLVRAALDEAIKQKTEYFIEFRVTWPDRTTHWLASRGRARYDASGNPIRMSGVTAEITQRRQAEEARAFLASIVSSSDDAVVGKDLQSRVVSWNVGAERMFGYTAAEMLGHPITLLLAPDRLDEEPKIIEEVKRGRTRHFETIRIHKDGHPIDVSLTISPILGPDGKIIGVSSIARDITDRIRAQEQVLRLNSELEHRVQERTAELTAANQEMEAFTYSVAHDLRAPLRHIDAFTRILYEDFSSLLPPEAIRYLENIRGGSQNMSRLVDDLLNLARVGRQELKRQPTPLGDIVNQVVNELKSEAQGRNIEWKIRSLPVVQCDAGLMKLVFANLLSNAIKYTRPRPVAVIEVGANKTNGSSTVFIRDNGVGFNMKYVDKLFGVFQRLHRAEEFEGTGVGLATVDRIIRKHGGAVWAQAEVNKGATFFFTLARSEKHTTGGHAPDQSNEPD
jgi:PAS domain S-box-containing protein